MIDNWHTQPNFWTSWLNTEAQPVEDTDLGVEEPLKSEQRGDDAGDAWAIEKQSSQHT